MPFSHVGFKLAHMHGVPLPVSFNKVRLKSLAHLSMTSTPNPFALRWFKTVRKVVPLSLAVSRIDTCAPPFPFSFQEGAPGLPFRPRQ
jgi:hypothetical protein